jgi:RimJ/RimL family protein N-acetyltransferase
VSVETLRTERLVLRAWQEADAAAILAIYAHDDVWPWLGAHPAPLPDLDAARARPARWDSFADGLLGLWAVDPTGVPAIGVDVPRPCGSVLLVPLPRSDGHPSGELEVGWHLHPGAWGHGVATEAAGAMLARARTVGLTRVHAVVRPDNVRSLAVCARLGMTRLGCTQEWYGVELEDFVLEL